MNDLERMAEIFTLVSQKHKKISWHNHAPDHDEKLKEISDLRNEYFVLAMRQLVEFFKSGKAKELEFEYVHHFYSDEEDPLLMEPIIEARLPQEMSGLGAGDDDFAKIKLDGVTLKRDWCSVYVSADTAEELKAFIDAYQLKFEEYEYRYYDEYRKKLAFIDYLMGRKEDNFEKP